MYDYMYVYLWASNLNESLHLLSFQRDHRKTRTTPHLNIPGKKIFYGITISRLYSALFLSHEIPLLFSDLVPGSGTYISKKTHSTGVNLVKKKG